MPRPVGGLYRRLKSTDRKMQNLWVGNQYYEAKTIRFGLILLIR